MATDEEIEKAFAAGRRVVEPLLEVRYCERSDQVTFVTPWGEHAARRCDIAELRGLDPGLMAQLVVSHTGLHIEALDLDLSSAGLLADLFPELRPVLINSY